MTVCYSDDLDAVSVFCLLKLKAATVSGNSRGKRRRWRGTHSGTSFVLGLRCGVRDQSRHAHDDSGRQRKSVHAAGGTTSAVQQTSWYSCATSTSSCAPMCCAIRRRERQTRVRVPARGALTQCWQKSLVTRFLSLVDFQVV